MIVTVARLALTLPLLALAAGAQDLATDPDPLRTGPHPPSDLRFEPSRFDLRMPPSALRLSSVGAPRAMWTARGGSSSSSLLGAPFEGASPGPAGSGGRSIRRSDLELGGTVAFEDLPGGVVFGRTARVEAELDGARLAWDVDRLTITTRDGRVHPVVEADPALLRTCLAIARAERIDQTLIDLRVDGTVDFAPELVDTAAGLVLLRCDRVPHAVIPAMRDSKSLVVDRGVWLARDPATGELVPGAELEVRFYRAAARGSLLPEAARPVVALTPVGRLASELEEGARIAAWVGFCRWAVAVDPVGTTSLAASLSTLPTSAVETPRWIDPYRQLGPAGLYRSPSRVEEWMRLHRQAIGSPAPVD